MEQAAERRVFRPVGRPGRDRYLTGFERPVSAGKKSGTAEV